MAAHYIEDLLRRPMLENPLDMTREECELVHLRPMSARRPLARHVPTNEDRQWIDEHEQEIENMLRIFAPKK